MFKRLFSAALVLGAAALAPPVAAQVTTCAKHEQISAYLSEKFGETLFGTGRQAAKVQVELWTAQDSRTWTILVARPDGISCVVSHGTGWLTVLPDLADELNPGS